MMNDEKSKFNLTGLLVGILQITFIVLKLCKVIPWNWWLVFLPIIIYGGLIIIMFVFTLALVLIIAGKENN